MPSLSVFSERFLSLSVCALDPWPVDAAKSFNFPAAFLSSSPGLASRAVSESWVLSKYENETNLLENKKRKRKLPYWCTECGDGEKGQNDSHQRLDVNHGWVIKYVYEC